MSKIKFARYLVLTILSFVMLPNSYGQYKKGFKLLDNKDYEGARVAFESDLGDENDYPMACYGLAQLYSNEKYEEYDYVEAYNYINKSSTSFGKLDNKQRSKLQNAGLGNLRISNVKNKIIASAFAKAEKENTEIGYANFVKHFPDADIAKLETAINKRDQYAYTAAKKAKTYSAARSLYENYGETMSEYQPELYIDAQKLLFERYIGENSWSAYDIFKESYPENVYVQDSILAADFRKIATSGDVEQYRTYIQLHPDSPFNKIAVDSLYVYILKHPTIGDYDFLVRHYPHHEDADKIWEGFYELYLEENGLESVFDFDAEYPEFPNQERIEQDKAKYRGQIEKPAYEKLLKSESIEDFMVFFYQYPNSPYTAELESKMLVALQETPNAEGAALFASLYPKSEDLQIALDQIFEAHAATGELQDLQTFITTYPRYQNSQRFQAEKALAEQAVALRLDMPMDARHRERYVAYIEAAAPRTLAFVALQRYIQRDIDNKYWRGAIAKVERFMPFFGEEHYEMNQLLALLVEADEKIEKEMLKGGINTTMSEYVPLLTADEKQLYYCRFDAGEMNENIYVADWDEEQQAWSKGKPIEEINSDRANEGPMCISTDGTLLTLFITGNLFTTTLTKDGWGAPQPLSSTINSDAWDADAMMTADGNALIFASRRDGVLGFNRNGKTACYGDNNGNSDIFISFKQADGSWSEPMNIGAQVNTPFAERSPFLHYDMKTLYFSSEGHGSLGKMDVYKTVRLDDTWTNWSEPVNLGKGINTSDNDWGYKITRDGAWAYFSAASDTKGSDMDIYKVSLPTKARPDDVCTVTGVLMSPVGEPVEASVVYEDLSTNEVIGELKSNPQTGEFFVVLPEGRQYSYFVQEEGYFPQASSIELKEGDCPQEIHQNIEMIKIEEMINQEIALSLENLFFDVNKYDIKPASFPELDRLVSIIQQYDLNIDIAGHTDNQGSNYDNKILSDNRANAVRQYLIDKGCMPMNITAKGYGEDNPVASNDTAEGRAKNRRVEVRFSMNQNQ